MAKRVKLYTREPEISQANQTKKLGTFDQIENNIEIEMKTTKVRIVASESSVQK